MGVEIAVGPKGVEERVEVAPNLPFDPAILARGATTAFNWTEEEQAEWERELQWVSRQELPATPGTPRPSRGEGSSRWGRRAGRPRSCRLRLVWSSDERAA